MPVSLYCTLTSPMSHHISRGVHINYIICENFFLKFCNKFVMPCEVQSFVMQIIYLFLQSCRKQVNSLMGGNGDGGFHGIQQTIKLSGSIFVHNFGSGSGSSSSSCHIIATKDYNRSTIRNMSHERMNNEHPSSLQTDCCKYLLKKIISAPAPGLK